MKAWAEPNQNAEGPSGRTGPQQAAKPRGRRAGEVKATGKVEPAVRVVRFRPGGCSAELSPPGVAEIAVTMESPDGRAWAAAAAPGDLQVVQILVCHPF